MKKRDIVIAILRVMGEEERQTRDKNEGHSVILGNIPICVHLSFPTTLLLWMRIPQSGKSAKVFYTRIPGF